MYPLIPHSVWKLSHAHYWDRWQCGIFHQETEIKGKELCKAWKRRSYDFSKDLPVSSFDFSDLQPTQVEE